MRFVAKFLGYGGVGCICGLGATEAIGAYLGGGGGQGGWALIRSPLTASFNGIGSRQFSMTRANTSFPSRE